MINTIINDFKENQIKYIVIAHSLIENKIYNHLIRDGFIVVDALDARSAGYMATGIAAEKKQCVALITENNNDSRNCYSALTEAYYKELPIIFLTIDTGFSLDYSNELNDTIFKTCFVRNVEEWNPLIINNCIKRSLPIHIIITYKIEEKTNYIDIDTLRNKLFLDDIYIYVSNSIKRDLNNNERFCITGGCDGIVSNVLGASLSNRYKKYIGIATDTELLHDINAFGNRYMKDSVSFIIFYENKKDLIKDYALDLGFDVLEGVNSINKVLDNKKTLLFIEGKKYEHGM